MDANFAKGFIKQANLFKNLPHALNANAKTVVKSGKEWQEGLKKARETLKAKQKPSYLEGINQKKNPVIGPSPYRQGNTALHSNAVEEYHQMAAQNRFKTPKTPKRPLF